MKFKNRIANNTIIFCAILTVAFAAASLLVGKFPLTVSGLLSGDEMQMRVFLTLRLPRTVMALVSGFVLGVAGTVYQTVFRNPLAAPDIIGVAGGASAGAAVAILFFSSSLIATTLTSFAGAITAVLLCLGISAIIKNKQSSTVVLAGIAINAIAQTVLMFLKLAADPEKELASIEYWIMGSLNAITINKLPLTLIISSISVLALFLLYRQILLLSVDTDEAKMLGVNIERMRLAVLLLATLAVSSVISVTGIISFVGLLAPHIAKLILKKQTVATMLMSGIIGSLLLIIADILARSVAQNELPVSIFTSLLGAPFLIYWLVRKNNV